MVYYTMNESLVNAAFLGASFVALLMGYLLMTFIAAKQEAKLKKLKTFLREKKLLQAWSEFDEVRK